MTYSIRIDTRHAHTDGGVNIAAKKRISLIRWTDGSYWLLSFSHLKFKLIDVCTRETLCTHHVFTRSYRVDSAIFIQAQANSATAMLSKMLTTICRNRRNVFFPT